jgi:hypothetical protein
LTVSVENILFFYSICILFGGESNWTVTVIRDIKNLTEDVKKCEGSAIHNENNVKFNIFSFGDNVPAEL